MPILAVAGCEAWAVVQRYGEHSAAVGGMTLERWHALGVTRAMETVNLFSP